MLAPRHDERKIDSMPPSITQSQLLPILAAIVAFLFAALLILYIFRLLFGRRIKAPGPRNRPRRLDIVDTFDLDRERQLVIVRRDNVEHLVLIGGPNDLLIEASINRAEARVLPAREKETATGPAGWPHAPGPSQQPPMQPPGLPPLGPILAPPSAGEALKRKTAEPAPPPLPGAPPPLPPGLAPLPPDLFAPPPPKPGPAPEAPPARPAAPSRFTPSRTGFTPTPRPVRPAPPPFLSRAQRPAGPPTAEAAPPPPPPAPEIPPPTEDASHEPPPPVETPVVEAAPPAPPPIEEASPPPPAPPPSAPPPEEPVDPLESLEAEMARLLGRPDAKP